MLHHRNILVKNWNYLLIKKINEIYEKGNKGGIFNIPHRYAKANNCYFFNDKIEKTIKLSKE